MMKIIRRCIIQRIIYNFKPWFLLDKMGVIKFFLNRFIISRKCMEVYFNERNEVHECYSFLKAVILAYLHVGFFTVFFLKHIHLNDSVDI